MVVRGKGVVDGGESLPTTTGECGDFGKFVFEFRASPDAFSGFPALKKPVSRSRHRHISHLEEIYYAE